MDGGTTWTNRDITGAANETIKAVAYSDALHLFVAVGSNQGSAKVYLSANTVTWESISVPDNSFEPNDVIWGSRFSKFVIVGTKGRILTSPDGRTWTNEESRVETSLNAAAQNEVSASSNNCTAVGEGGTILESSAEETQWSRRTGNFSNTLVLTGVTKNYSTISADQHCTLRRNSSGSWESATTILLPNISHSVVFGGIGSNQIYVVVGETSEDSQYKNIICSKTPAASNWTARLTHSGNPGDLSLKKVIWSSIYGKFYAVGKSNLGAVVYFSDTGVDWEPPLLINDSVGKTLYGICEGHI